MSIRVSCIIACPHTQHSIKDTGVVTRDELRGRVQILHPSAKVIWFVVTGAWGQHARQDGVG